MPKNCLNIYKKNGFRNPIINLLLDALYTDRKSITSLQQKQLRNQIFTYFEEMQWNIPASWTVTTVISRNENLINLPTPVLDACFFHCAFGFPIVVSSWHCGCVVARCWTYFSKLIFRIFVRTNPSEFSYALIVAQERRSFGGVVGSFLVLDLARAFLSQFNFFFTFYWLYYFFRRSRPKTTTRTPVPIGTAFTNFGCCEISG